MIKEVNTSFTEKQKEYLMRFTKGEQYIELRKTVANISNPDPENQEVIEEIPKRYFWEQREVYNLLHPVYERFIKSGGNDERWYDIAQTLIPYQKEYNKLKNKKLEFIDRLGAGVLMVEDGSVDVDNIEEEELSPNKCVVYRQGSMQPDIKEIATTDDVRTLDEIETLLLQRFYELVNRMTYVVQPDPMVKWN